MKKNVILSLLLTFIFTFPIGVNAREYQDEKQVQGVNESEINSMLLDNGQMLSITNINIEMLDDYFLIGDPLNCESLKNTSTYKIIRDIFKWMQILAPVILVIFGVLDFGKAVAASDADAMKKAQGAFVKRAIIAAVIILLPFVMDLLIMLLDGALGVDTCGIGT